MHPVARGHSEHPVNKVRISQPKSVGKPAAGGSNQNDATSCSQVWLTDAKLSERARKLAAVDTNQDQSFQESVRKLAAEKLDINDEDDSKWPRSLRVSGAYVPHFEKVYSNLRQQLKRKPEDKMEDFDVTSLIWRMLMIVTQQASVHLANDYLDNSMKQLFDVPRNLVSEQTQIQGINLFD